MAPMTPPADRQSFDMLCIASLGSPESSNGSKSVSVVAMLSADATVISDG